MNEAQNQQIIELQTRLAFQEDALNTMSEQMAVFSTELQMATKQIHLLSNKLKDTSLQVDNMADTPVNERPPHY